MLSPQSPPPSGHRDLLHQLDLTMGEESIQLGTEKTIFSVFSHSVDSPGHVSCR